MDFSFNWIKLGIVLLTILPIDKRWCNAANEIAYTFRYSIDENQVVLQHWEERHSDIVHGSYSLLGPDGRVRIVEYQVSGRDGFRAVVTYRKPGIGAPFGHLRYPISFQTPIILATPVSYITKDLFKTKKMRQTHQ